MTQDAEAISADQATIAAEPGGVADERPELLVAAAFAGAFVFARILKKIAA